MLEGARFESGNVEPVLVLQRHQRSRREVFIIPGGARAVQHRTNHREEALLERCVFCHREYREVVPGSWKRIEYGDPALAQQTSKQRQLAVVVKPQQMQHAVADDYVKLLSRIPIHGVGTDELEVAHARESLFA